MYVDFARAQGRESFNAVLSGRVYFEFVCVKESKDFRFQQWAGDG
jgi:hypothetical protein